MPLCVYSIAIILTHQPHVAVCPIYLTFMAHWKFQILEHHQFLVNYKHNQKPIYTLKFFTILNFSKSLKQFFKFQTYQKGKNTV